jgi:hypothetical protein
MGELVTDRQSDSLTDGVSRYRHDFAEVEEAEGEFVGFRQRKPVLACQRADGLIDDLSADDGPDSSIAVARWALPASEPSA